MQRRTVTRIRYTFAALLLLAGVMAGPASAQQAAQAQPAAKAGAKQASVLDDAMVQFQAKRGLDLLYNMRFEQARALFDLIDQRYPDHPIGPFLQALDTWWRILLDLSDEQYDDAFFDAMNEVIRRSDRILKKDKNNFDAMFFKGAALGFRGRLRSNRGDWLAASRDGLRAMDYVLGVAKKDPANSDYVFGKGIYDYYAAAVRERYPFARPVMAFFPDGDKERGIRALERTAKEGRFIQTEAAYFLLQIYYLFEKDYAKSVEYVTWLRDRYPDNAFFHTLEGRIYARWSEWERAEPIFAEVLARYERQQTGYNVASAEQALYYLARGRMRVGAYNEALTYLNQLEVLGVKEKRDGYFNVLGRLRQGMVHDVLGNRDAAVAAYRKVLKMKNHGDAHERAREYLGRPYKG